MLKFLKIKNIALISGVELELGPGLTLLTGETGAGKSILIDALGLLLGARASADLIRTGEEHASSRRSSRARDAAGVARARTACPRRTTRSSSAARSRPRARGAPPSTARSCPSRVLRELGAAHRATSTASTSRRACSTPRRTSTSSTATPGSTATGPRVAEPFRRLREVEAALEALRRDRREAERRREMLEFQAGEIEQAALAAGRGGGAAPGEAAAGQRRAAGRRSRGEAYALLYEDEEAVLDAARPGLPARSRSWRASTRASRRYVEARGAVRAQLEDLALFLRDYREALQVSPGRLDEIESRLALIERLKRKYGATVEEVLAFAERCRAELRDLGSPEERERALEQRARRRSPAAT